MSTFFPEGKKITVGGEEFAVKPFVLTNRIKVLRILAETLLEYNKVNPTVKVQDLVNPEIKAKVIFDIIAVAGDRLIDVYEIVLGKDREWLLSHDVTLRNEFEIIQAISEVNDLPFLFSQVKGLAKTLKLQRTS